MGGLGRWTSGLPFNLESPAYLTNYDNPAMSFNVGHVITHRNITNGVPHVFTAATASAINNGICFGNPVRLPYAGEAGQRNIFRGDGYFDIRLFAHQELEPRPLGQAEGRCGGL